MCMACASKLVLHVWINCPLIIIIIIIIIIIFIIPISQGFIVFLGLL